MAVRSRAKESKNIFRAFATFAVVSNLRLNMAKTIAIPLSDVSPAHMQAEMEKDLSMPQLTWADTGKYLGFY